MSDFPKTITVGDMKLEINPLDPGDMLDFFEAFDSNKVGKKAWFRYAMWICSVRAVNGVPVLFPKDGEDIKILGKRLGHKGVLAVQECLDGDEGKPAVGQVDVAAAKN